MKGCREFETVPLGNLTSLISSGSTPLGGESVYLKSGPVMLLRSQNVRMNELDISDVAFITNEIDSGMKRSVVRTHDVLLNITGASIGRVAEFGLTDARANVNQHVCIIRPLAERLHSKFLTYFLSSPSVQHEINNRHQHGGTRQALTFSQIAGFEIPLPPLSEQKRIADILDKADAIRRRHSEMPDTTRSLILSKFRGMFGADVSLRQDWKVVELDSLVNPKRPITYGILMPGPDLESGIPYVRVVDIQNDRILTNQVRRTSTAIANEYRRSTIREGDILLSIRGHVGRLGIVPSTLTGGNITQDSARIDVNEARYRSYLFWFLDSAETQSWMMKHVRGVAVKGINLGDVRRIPVPVPPVKLVEEFDRFQIRASQCRSKQELSQKVADDLFKSLVQRAFMGNL